MISLVPIIWRALMCCMPIKICTEEGNPSQTSSLLLHFPVSKHCLHINEFSENPGEAVLLPYFTDMKLRREENKKKPLIFSV